MSEANQINNGPFRNYKEAVEWITDLAPAIGMKPGLDRIRKLMEMLGHPERRLKFIHVAGTNGKGSTCAYLEEVLRQSGYDVGSFTSPYIARFTDRIRYNGHDIREEDVLLLANRLRPLADQIAESELGPLTMFEICTAMAIVYFASVTYPDYVVWETGLGGRLDVTNIVAPVVTVITNIGHDHMDILGNTLQEVAAEKAGIIKGGVPVICGVKQPEAIEVIREQVRAKRTTLYLSGSQFSYETVTSQLGEQVFHFNGPFRRLEQIRISMNGEHQIENAALTIMTIEVLRQYYALIVEDEVLYEALQKTKWPGRLELIADRPRLVIDGAHNPEGAEALAKSIQHLFSYRKLHVMIGMLSTKSHLDYLRHILPLVNSLIVTEPEWGKKIEAERLAQIAEQVRTEQNLSFEMKIVPQWKEALQLTRAMTGPDDLALITGTLYLISDVRSWVLYQSEAEKGW